MEHSTSAFESPNAADVENTLAINDHRNMMPTMNNHQDILQCTPVAGATGTHHKRKSTHTETRLSQDEEHSDDSLAAKMVKLEQLEQL
jgi:hypothetical protein